MADNDNRSPRAELDAELAAAVDRVRGQGAVNHANHHTVLVYVHEGGELEVGTVTCVPRKGEIVELLVEGARHAYRVEQVTWSPNDEACLPSLPTQDAAYRVRFTVVRCALSRCP